MQKVQAQLDALATRDGIPVLYGYGVTGSPPSAADLHVAFNRSLRLFELSY